MGGHRPLSFCFTARRDSVGAGRPECGPFASSTPRATRRADRLEGLQGRPRRDLRATALSETDPDLAELLAEDYPYYSASGFIDLGGW